jgi:environmental stress-induced protein Ves
VSTVLRGADLPVTPWRNGGGSTREVAAHPPGAADFTWRVSLADVAAPGPFSAFDGVDRTIVLLAGPAMQVEVAGDRHDLFRHVPFAFDGGAPTSCAVPGGPTHDLNVMTRRGLTRLRAARRARAAGRRRGGSARAPSAPPAAPARDRRSVRRRPAAR